MSIDRLKDPQCAHYNLIRRENKTSCDPQDFLIDSSPVCNRDLVVAYESQKCSADNSLQFDKIMAISKAVSVAPFKMKIHGTPYFKRQG